MLGDDAAIFCRWYGVTGQGNFEGTDEHVLFQALPGSPPPDNLQTLHQKLLTVRNQRAQPLRDVKLLAGWNGLTIAALGRGAALTSNQRWLKKAEQAAAFITNSLIRSDGRLLRSWCHGSPSVIPAFLEDYGFLAWGLLELHRAGSTANHLQQATQLCEQALQLFRLPDGCFSTSGTDQQPLPLCLPDRHDGVVPAGASALALNLVLLAEITGDKNRLQEADQVLQQLLPVLAGHPVSGLWLLRAAMMREKISGSGTGRIQGCPSLCAATHPGPRPSGGG